MRDTGVKKLAVLMLPIAAFAAAISVSAAQTEPPSNVTQRQHGMKVMADAAKRINAMFKDSTPYDATMFKAASDDLVDSELAGMACAVRLLSPVIIATFRPGA